ncbi:unnamed protein product [Rotaria sp. Silwood2]|nr:unnamed protein product [Rotaria sp. Silwood2]CAF3049412.1 unnamed protein product [Rotaria sp. Silwood2]CAF4239805.1 unnamed protein product [Rotaria sp. Silwood2]CAF4534377.1 unnamed protein product [Rotaria sp. Silwood2]
MRTLSLRGVQLHSTMEVLFCNVNEREARYKLNPYGQTDYCFCFYPMIDDIRMDNRKDLESSISLLTSIDTTFG